MKVRSSIKTMCKHCYAVQRGKTRYIYCKMTPKHKQRQGYHTMVHQEGGFCIVCGLNNEVDRMLSTTAETVLPQQPMGIVDSLTSSFSNMRVMNNVETPISIKYQPSVGIFSILA